MFEDYEWRLAFDSFFMCQGGGARIVLYAPDGNDVSLSFKLKFHRSNNEAG